MVNSVVQPAEWYRHSGCWLAFPYAFELWGEQIPAVQQEFSALVAEIARSELVRVLVPDETVGQIARKWLVPQVELVVCPFGDIWMRDIAPIFVHDVTSGQVVAQTFQWNGWGNKYVLAGDELVSRRVADWLGVPSNHFPFVLEGGAIEVDGLGTGLTTKQCLLNPNRNPHLHQTEIEAGLQSALGVRKLLWLEEGLRNDHTDGHIDTIARFIAPQRVMCMLAEDASDPNYRVLGDIYRQLQDMRDVDNNPLEVIPIPSPHTVLDPDGELLPASYLNFYISNSSVIVPIYGVANDDRAVATIAKYFPDRRVVGLSARQILVGGGAFHCITQQQPSPYASSG